MFHLHGANGFSKTEHAVRQIITSMWKRALLGSACKGAVHATALAGVQTSV